MPGGNAEIVPTGASGTKTPNPTKEKDPKWNQTF
jgi:hypothetical protein